MIALNHSFLREIALEPARAVAAATFIEHVRRRTQERPMVYERLAEFETGKGPFVQWANRYKGDAELGPLVTFLLQSVSGPFLPEARFDGPVEPSFETVDGWLEEIIRRLLAIPRGRSLSGLVSPEPAGGANAPTYRSPYAAVSNWHDASAFDQELITTSVGSTIDVLLAAEKEMSGQLVVLPSAKRSAEVWALDCAASELHRALLGLEVYVAALGERLHRDACAERYHQRTTVPMSAEKSAVGKNPVKRQRRTFVANGHGVQYFDMHAKPGNMTRVHIWTPPPETAVSPMPIYVGHCGRHL